MSRKHLLFIIMIFGIASILSIDFSVKATGTANYRLLGIPVSGYISENTTWTLDGSPYIVVGNVIVEPNVFLTIQPGVVVKFTNGTSLVIDGSLIAQGNSTHRIVFTSNATTPTHGSWGKIIYRGSKLILDYTDIKYADTGISVESGANSLNIANSAISRCRTGIREGYDVSLIANNVTITENLDIGLVCRGWGPYPTDRLTNTKIVNNGGYGIYAAEGSFMLSNSEVSDNSYWGIYLMSGRATITNCRICRNEGYGIYGGFDVLNSTISYNNGTGLRGNGHIVKSKVVGNEGDGIESYGGEAHYNSIFNNTGYDFEVSTQDVNATYNWWGTTNDTVIQEHIYDYYDDYNLGKVYYKPLLLSPYFVAIEGDIFYVDISSNSSITNFNFNQLDNYVSFDATGPNQAIGFCNVSIPNELLWGSFSVYKDGSPLVKGVDYTEAFNGTRYIFYITYAHTTQTIKIIGTEVIPEFPSFMIMPLFMIATLLAIIVYRRKKSKMRTVSHFQCSLMQSKSV